MSGAEAILGIVAGGAGLLSLSIQLGESAVKLRQIYMSAKDAPKNISNVVFGLETLAIILREMEQQRQTSAHLEPLLLRCISQCQEGVAEVQELVNRIEAQLSRYGRIGGKLYATLKEPELAELLDRLERTTSHLELAYMIYLRDEQLRLFQASKHALDLQSSMLHDINKNLRTSGHRALTVAREPSQTTGMSAEISRDVADNATFDQPSKGNQGNFNTSRCQLEPVSPMKVQRKRSKKIFQVRLQLPKFMSNLVWDLAVTRSQSCHNMYLRTYNIIPVNSLIVDCCNNGDLGKVRELFRKGEASPLDMINDAFGVQHTLLKLAARNGHVDLCRYLLSEANWPDYSTVLTRALDCFAIYSSHRRLATSPGATRTSKGKMYRLLVGHAEFDINLEKIHRYAWFYHCDDAECLSIILDNLFAGFDTYPVEARFELASRLFSASVTDFLNCTGLTSNDPKLATMKNSSGTSTLHWIAKSLLKCFQFHQFDNDEIASLINLGIKILRNGADPCSMADTNDWMFQPCKHHIRTTTPLLLFLGMENLGLILNKRPRRTAADVLSLIRIWAKMIQDAGLNLCVYGNMEREAWKRLGCKLSLRLFTTQVTNLVSGPTLADWSLRIRYPQYRCLYSLQPPPGSFPTDQHTPTKIAWHPTLMEESEGHWSLVEQKCLLGKDTDLRDLDPSGSTSIDSWLKDTQDDSSIIALMQHRASVKRQTAKRSHSQPPLLRRRELDYYPSRFSVLRPWLESYHLCPFDSNWRFDCSEHHDSDGMYEDYAYLSDYHEWKISNIRRCVEGDLGFRCSVQESIHWQDSSFLAEIVRCQSECYGEWHCAPQTSITHTGTQDCPQGCANIDLTTVKVPSSLRKFHPVSPDF